MKRYNREDIFVSISVKVQRITFKWLLTICGAEGIRLLIKSLICEP